MIFPRFNGEDHYLEDNIEHNNQVDDSITFTGDVEGAIVPINGISGGGLGGISSITYSCGVWEFSDGNGGVYIMLRNCIRN